MKNIALTLLVFTIGITSCISEKKETPKIKFQKEELEKNKVIPVEVKVSAINLNDEIVNKKEHLKLDTTNTFIVDGYPISDRLFKGNYGMMKSGKLISYDKAWFKNKELNQTIIFELYTDYHRLVTYHFDNSNIPKGLIKRMELHTGKGEIASPEIKKLNFFGLINQSIDTESKIFTTNRGISLGDGKEKIIKIYGNPDKRKVEEGFEILEWSFEGDEIYNDNFISSKKPIARNSFGHKITLYFKKGKLSSQILYNDIP